ncbi:MAG: hypothetical protein NTU95_06660 [Methanothrix sp.]|nr:hypothetical protein [Methanothrix sp.]
MVTDYHYKGTTVHRGRTEGGIFCQEGNITTAPVIYSIAVSSPITPAEPLLPLPENPRGSLVIVEGRAPGVGHGPAPDEHASPAAAVVGLSIRAWGRWSWPAIAGRGRWDRL